MTDRREGQDRRDYTERRRYLWSREGPADRRVIGSWEADLSPIDRHARRVRHKGRRSGDVFREGILELEAGLGIPLKEDPDPAPLRLFTRFGPFDRRQSDDLTLSLQLRRYNDGRRSGDGARQERRFAQALAPRADTLPRSSTSTPPKETPLIREILDPKLRAAAIHKVLETASRMEEKRARYMAAFGGSAAGDHLDDLRDLARQEDAEEADPAPGDPLDGHTVENWGEERDNEEAARGEVPQGEELALEFTTWEPSVEPEKDRVVELTIRVPVANYGHEGGEEDEAGARFYFEEHLCVENLIDALKEAQVDDTCIRCAHSRVKLLPIGAELHMPAEEDDPAPTLDDDLEASRQKLAAALPVIDRFGADALKEILALEFGVRNVGAIPASSIPTFVSACQKYLEEREEGDI